jgi:hypothetical protein
VSEPSNSDASSPVERTAFVAAPSGGTAPLQVHNFYIFLIQLDVRQAKVEETEKEGCLFVIG